ncbi:hypothetical protein [Actinoplanes sp. NPDC026619]|uniref:hypothetical protein n=1 Tax=Actinoplanes sp. NPDC026619 TaxID=3155798 RepID=UPI0033EEB835
MEWFGVRCIFHYKTNEAYEERITVWETESFTSAIALAEKEAAEYADDVGCTYVDLAQAYRLDEPPGNGAEVFSLIRKSDLGSNAYVGRFFSTGKEIT